MFREVIIVIPATESTATSGGLIDPTASWTSVKKSISYEILRRTENNFFIIV